MKRVRRRQAAARAVMKRTAVFLALIACGNDTPQRTELGTLL
jgi:hypothetical protein